MKRRILQWVCCFAVVLMAGSAMAFTLTTGFDGVTKVESDLTTTSGLNQWNDLERWQIQSSGGHPGYWAQQTPRPTGGPENSLLFYGFDAAGLGAGSSYLLQFDFINSTRESHQGSVYLGGLNFGEGISRFAPWPNLSTTYFFQAPLEIATDAWTTRSYGGTLSENYDVLFLAFDMGGVGGLRGIDNVFLEVTPVPEPSTVLLLAAGLGSFAFWRRRKAAL